MDYATSAGAFVLALALNAFSAGKTGELSRTASQSAVAAGGLNTDTRAFSIWGVFYTLYAVAYVWAGVQGERCFPAALAVAWIANAAWILLSSQALWTPALVSLLAYACCIVLALPGLTASEQHGSLQLAGVASAGLLLWLLVATLLNWQIVVPCQARALRALALPLVLLTAAALAGAGISAGSWGVGRALFACSVAAWIVAAIEGKLGGERLGTPPKEPSTAQ